MGLIQFHYYFVLAELYFFLILLIIPLVLIIVDCEHTLLNIVVLYLIVLDVLDDQLWHYFVE